ncbi:MAG: membrane protein insertase YidC [marine bacterium B5-7]|nr:MAG: membrane protein insertase YidC [marine bacterium B5-7]
MMETQRLILYVALGLVLMLLWQSWIKYTLPPSAVPTTTSQGVESDSAVPDDGSVPVVPSSPDAPESTQVAPETPVDSDSAGQLIVVDTDLFRVDISTIGADIREVELKKYSVDVEHPDQPLVLMTPDQPDVFISETGLLGRDSSYPNHKTSWSIEGDRFKLGDGDQNLKVVFTYTSDDGVSYRKVYTFNRNSYLIDLEYQIQNSSNESWSGYQYAQFARTQVAQKGSMGFLGRLPSFKGGAIYTPEEKFQKIKFSNMTEEDLSQRAPDGWVSVLQHYFVGAWLPASEGPYEFYSSVSDRATNPLYRIGYKDLSPLTLQPGDSGTLDSRLYIGPKEQSRMKGAAEGLVLSVDYGWLTAIAAPLFWLISWIHKIVGNWGWSIIFLTILIKLAFFPLSAASYRSMAKMKNLQPRLKTLKERYGDDRQKFQQEMMKIYKVEKINPLGGCLPIVVQIPVFIALYWVLLESVELRQATWFWLKDLSVKDPFYILPVLMGISMLVQQKLNPAPMDDIQKKVMMALPIVFTVFFLFFPSGLVLYWVVNNVLSITQQWFITNKLQTKK